MRIAITFCTALLAAAAPASAKQGDPVPGADVSAEESPGGIIVHFGSVAEARTACTGTGGAFSNRGGRIVCSHPSPQFRRRGRGICIGRAGGAYLSAQSGGPNLPACTAAPSPIRTTPPR